MFLILLFSFIIFVFSYIDLKWNSTIFDESIYHKIKENICEIDSLENMFNLLTNYKETYLTYTTTDNNIIIKTKYLYEHPLIIYNIKYFTIDSKIEILSNLNNINSEEYFNIEFLEKYNNSNIFYICVIENKIEKIRTVSIAENSICKNLICFNNDGNNEKNWDINIYINYKDVSFLIYQRAIICNQKTSYSNYFLPYINSNSNISYYQFNKYEYFQNSFPPDDLEIEKYNYDIIEYSNFNKSIKKESSSIEKDDSSNKIKYFCTRNSFISILTKNNQNYYNTRYISFLDSSIIPNYQFEIRKIKGVVNGIPIGEKEEISVKIVSEDLSFEQIILSNITKIDYINENFEIEFYLTNNLNLLGENYYILVSQFDTKFNDLNKNNDFKIQFIENIFITNVENDKLIKFNGGSIIYIQIKENDFLTNSGIDNFICSFYYGLSIKVNSILYYDSSSQKYYCNSPDLTYTTMKYYFLELSIENSVYSSIKSNSVTLKLYYYNFNENFVDLYPEYLSYDLKSNIYLIFKDIKNGKNFLHSAVNVKCKFINENYNNEKEFIFDGSVIIYNNTINCENNFQFSNIAEKRYYHVYFSINNGYDWEDFFTYLYLYPTPTFSSYTISLDSEKKYIISIEGENFIESIQSTCIFKSTSNNFLLYNTYEYINSTNIKCHFSYISPDNEFNILISYNYGLELVDTGYILSYSNKRYIKSIEPNFDTNNIKNNIQIYTNDDSKNMNYINDDSICRLSFFNKDNEFELNEQLICLNVIDNQNLKQNEAFFLFSYSPIEIKFNDNYYTSSNITFFSINYTIKSITPSLGPIEGNTIVTIKGENFIKSNKLFIKLIAQESDSNNDEIIISSVTYINNTLIQFTTKSIDTLISKTTKIYDIYLSINSINYHQISNFNYTYYNNIEIQEINPNLNFVEDSISIIIKGNNIIDNDLLYCKIGDYYISKCENYNSEYLNCTCPILPYEYVSDGKLNNKEYQSHLSMKIYLSNNKQNYVESSTYFGYYNDFNTYQTNYKFYPKYGPEEGGTKIYFKFPEDYSSLKPNDLSNIESKCYFGNYEINGSIDIIDEHPIINCISPPLSYINNKINQYNINNLNYVPVNLKIVIPLVHMSIEVIYIYNCNVTTFSYYPNNIDFNLGNIIPIEINTSSVFYYINENIKCKFSNDNSEYIVNGEFVDFSKIICKSPSINGITELTKFNLSFSLNGYDYYNSLKNGSLLEIYYRQSENIININPSSLPIFSETNEYVNVTVDYFHEYSSLSKCILCNDDTINSKCLYSILIQDNNDPLLIYCQIPDLYEFSFSFLYFGGYLYLGISSNGIDFSSLKKIIFYVNPVITSVNKINIPINHKFDLEINGKNFYDYDGYILFVCENNFEYYYPIVYNTDYSILIYDISLSNCSPFQIVKIFLTYDKINFFSYAINCFTYEDIEIETYFPSVIHNLKTEYIFYTLKDVSFTFAFESYCQITDLNGNLIYIGQILFYGDNNMACDGINLINFQNYLGSNDYVKFSLLGNFEDPFSKNEINLYVILDINIDTTISLILNSYILNRDVIEIKGSDFDLTIKYYITLNYNIYYSNTESTTSSLNFIKSDNLIQKNSEYSISISSNLNDWITTNLYLQINTLLCKNGEICIDKNNIYSNTITSSSCPKGYYCINGLLLSCPIGTYNSITDSSSCTNCPSGKICTEIGLSIPLNCPDGYTCSLNGIFSKYQINPCPKGYYCTDSNTQTLCPNGFFCPEGTYVSSYYYNKFGSPQKCKDGITCDSKSSSYYSLHQYGNNVCQAGYFCQRGISYKCSEVTNLDYSIECTDVGLSQGGLCPIGTYKNDISIEKCTICTIGSYCPNEGTIKPLYCLPGRICEYEGQHRPSDYCPGGNYCTNSTIGYPTNLKDESTTEYKYYPQKCKSGQLCLLGIKTSITNENDPEAPSPCRAGLVCSEGTSSNSSLTLCPIGYYCPGNSNPIPAPVGTYVPGEGFTAPLQCAPGYYNDEIAQSVCKKCPAGTYTYLQGQTTCQSCEKGTYRDNSISSITCALCPAGTYNENIGSTSINDCIECPKGYLCDIEGMSDFSEQGRVCPSGYICKAGTNSDTIIRCPAGFYCGEKTSELYQYHFCSPGYYCEEGSTSTNNKKNPCIEGWYCPYASYLSYDSEGNAIIKISSLLNSVVQAKIDNDPNDSDLEILTIQYEENSDLPVEYINQKITDNDLACPGGTTSKPGSTCIGQCYKDEGSPSEIIEPLKDEDYNITEGRRLENTPTNIDTNKYNRYVLIEPYETIYISFNFSLIPSYMYLNKHYSIQILNNGVEEILPDYATKTFDNYPEYTKFVELKLFNINNYNIKLQIFILMNNELFNDYSDLFKNSAILKRSIPYRANSGKKEIFTFVLIEDVFTLNSLSLPYNFQLKNKGKILISYINSYNYLPSHGYSTRDPYSSTIFDDNELLYIFLPYIPFFSNCAGYDKYMYLYDILENENNCSYPSDIKIVDYFPWRGLKTKSDKCDLSFTCIFDELDQNVISNKWFSLTKETNLGYISKLPLTIDTNFNDENYFTETQISNFNELSSFIPFTFIPYRKGVDDVNCFPKDIIIIIKYYQYTTTKKKLIDFFVEMYNYSNCINLSSDIKSDYNGEYNLTIKFYPLDYFSLLNTFQFPYIAYLLIIFIMGILVIILLIIIFFFTNLAAKTEGTQYISLSHFFFWFILPFIKGISIGLIPITLLILIIYGIEYSNTFYDFSGTWNIYDLGGFTETKQNIYFNQSRIAIYFILIGFFLYRRGTKRLTPKPNESQNASIEKEKILNSHRNNSESSLSIDSSNEFEKKKEAYDDIDVEMYITISWKNRMLFIIYLIGIIYVSMKMVFIIYYNSEKYFILQIVCINILDLIFNEFILMCTISEALISIPFATINEIAKFLLVVSANDFKNSIICYIIIFLSFSVIQVYLYPKLDKIEFLIKTKFKLLLANSKKNKSLFYRMTNSFLITIHYDKIIDNLDEDMEKIRFIEEKNKLTIEPILRVCYSFSSKLMFLILLPSILYIMSIFPKEIHCIAIFHIRHGNMYYYIIFSVAIIIPELLIQYLILNYIQVIYGYRIEDYLGYCKYRYHIRLSDYIDSTQTMDISINSFWRSLDSLLFSEQFYLFFFYTSSSLLSLLIGVIIFMVNSYNPFDDPTLFVILLLYIGIFIAFHLALNAIHFLFAIFNQNNERINARKGKLLEFLKVDPNMKDIAQFTKADNFRHKFIKVNKDWIIDNLEYVLGLDKLDKDIGDTNEKAEAKLEKIYQDALNYEAIDQEIQKKRELIKRDLQLMPYNQKLVGEVNEEFNLRLDISKDSIIDEPYDVKNKINFDDIKDKDFIKDIAIFWREKAKEVIKIKLWSVDVINFKKKTYCEKCNATFNLHVFQSIPFIDLIRDFKKNFIGVNINISNWQRFYEKNQIFTTLCMECAYLKNSQYLINKINKENKKIGIIQSREQIEKGLKKSHIKGIAMMWLYEARAKILMGRMEKIKNNNNEDNKNDGNEYGNESEKDN